MQSHGLVANSPAVVQLQALNTDVKYAKIILYLDDHLASVALGSEITAHRAQSSVLHISYCTTAFRRTLKSAIVT
jgi:hypothetical protein